MTTIDALGNRHQSAGTPGGGQFATKANSAPAALLTQEEVDELIDRREAEAARDVKVAWADDVMRRTALAVTKSFRIDTGNADDITQDAWHDLLKRSKGLDELIQDKPLLQLVSRTIGNRDYSVGGQHGLRYEDFRALRVLREKEQEFRIANGRSMTKLEREEAANEIRMSLPAGRRPKPDFHVTRGTISIDAPIKGSDSDNPTTYGASLVAEEHLPFDRQEDAAADLLHAVDEGTTTATNARRDVWRVVAIRSGAPSVSARSLSSALATKHKKVVEASGGAHALAQRFIDGDATAAEADSLFAPFGDIDQEDRMKVANVFDDHPSFADHLWGEAVKVAARR